MMWFKYQLKILETPKPVKNLYWPVGEYNFGSKTFCLSVFLKKE